MRVHQVLERKELVGAELQHVDVERAPRRGALLGGAEVGLDALGARLVVVLVSMPKYAALIWARKLVNHCAALSRMILSSLA